MISKSCSFFFTRNCVYIPNFGLKIGIFLRFAPHFVIKIPEFCTPFFKSLRTGLKVSIKHKVSLSHTHKHVIFPFFKTSRKLSDIMECFLDHECQDLVRPSLTRPNLKWRSYTWLGGSTYKYVKLLIISYISANGLLLITCQSLNDSC